MSENTQVVVMDAENLVDPKEFGLDEEKGNEVASAFTPVIAEKNNLIPLYKEIISTTEITPALSQKASELRKKLVKVRTETVRIHKSAKEFYLAGGRFVDAWKNKNVTTIELMEEKLAEIEKFEENRQKQILAEVRKERLAIMQEFEGFNELIPFETMSPEEFHGYVFDQRLLKKAKQDEADRIARELEAEKERQSKIYQRKLDIAPYVQFINDVNALNIENSTDEVFEETLKNLRQQKAEYIEQQELIRQQNERLKAEAEQKATEEEEKQKVIKKRGEELKPYIIFVRDYAGLISSEESEYQKQFAEIKKVAEEQRKFDLQEELEKAQKIEAEAKAKREQEAKMRSLQLELEEKKNREARELAEKEEREQAELSMGDKEKFASLFTELEALKTKYSFKAKKNIALQVQINELIDKTVAFGQSKL